MSDYHALLSPSGADKWINCPNSIAAESSQPEVKDSAASDLGTDKHELLAYCLDQKLPAKSQIGRAMAKGNKVDADFAKDVQVVIDGVSERVKAYQLSGARVTVEIEQDVPIGHITGEVNATGRADVILLAHWEERGEICVIDAKFGYREVFAENNAQGMLYALGALEKFDSKKYHSVVIMIAQPAVSETFSEWPISTFDLLKWSDKVAEPAATNALWVYSMKGVRALKDQDFKPGEKQCQWCKANAVCGARAKKVKEIIGADFSQIKEVVLANMLTNEDLGDVWGHLDFIESWAKSVRGRIEFELMQGRAIPGVKLVEGRRGNRAWESDEEAESVLKSFRLRQEEMYSFKLLGPKGILEMLEGQPRRIKKMEALITQKQGKPHVTSVSDKRQALEIQPVDSDFEAVIDNSDLI